MLVGKSIEAHHTAAIVAADLISVLTAFICTCFLFCIASLLFSYSATQPQVCNKTQCQCVEEVWVSITVC